MRMDVEGEEKERKTEAEVDGQCECGLESDEDGCGGEEKERKTEAEVDEQCKCRLESDEDGCGGEKERKTEAEVDGQCECGLERVMRMNVEGRRRKGRLKQRWMDSGLESDEDGCGGEEKERKTEAKVDGQCE